MVPRPQLQELPGVGKHSQRLASELTTELEATLLRGVPLHLCLSRWAKHWDLSNIESARDADLALSRETQRFDAFLSHDWGTSRWLKLLAMLMVFNSRAAAISTTLVSVLSPVLASFVFGIEDSAGPMLLSFGTFWMVLCFWQRIRQCFRTPVIVFMDKLCIAQKDAHLKERGILGLASFLNHSECLTMLWSPRYFSRLWCTFEVAVFLRSQQKKHIRIMPVSFALLVFLISFVAHVGAFTYYFFSIREDVWKWLVGSTGMVDDWWMRATVLSSSFLPIAAVLGPTILYIGIGLMKDIDCLRIQLSCFSIQECKCYCCSINHQDPTTGLRVPCDREVIFTTLQEWYGNTDGEGASFVGPFNALVRDHLASIVRETLTDITGQLRYGMCMVAVVLVPLLPCFLMPNWEYLQDWSNRALVIFFMRNLLRWMKLPLLALFAYWVAIRNCELGMYLCQRKVKYLNQVVVSCLMTILSVTLVAMVWTPFEVVFFVTQDQQSLLLPAIPFLVLVMLDLCIFVPVLRLKWLSLLDARQLAGATSIGGTTQDMPHI